MMANMKLQLHHINLSTDRVDEMNDFYLNVMKLKTETEGLPVLEKKKGYSGDVAFVSDGKIQTHLAQKDLDVCFKTGHTINPLEKGHIAYRTDDLKAFTDGTANSLDIGERIMICYEPFKVNQY